MRKPEWQRKIAKERIKILFDLAEKEFKKFPFNNVNMNKILCHGCNEDDKTGTLEIIHHC
ncbi:MAG: hypothetical protein QW140_02275 [Candidatus Aenigmatarchaeota archaeon]